MASFIKVAKKCTLKDQKRPWSMMIKKFKLHCDIFSFSFLLPSIWRHIGETYVFLWTNYVTKHQFFRSSPGLTRFFKHILDSTLNTSIFHVNLRMLQIQLNPLPDVSNCTSQLKTSFMFYDCCLYIWIPHYSWGIKGAIPASFAFLKDVTVMSLIYYTS